MKKERLEKKRFNPKTKINAYLRFEYPDRLARGCPIKVTKNGGNYIEGLDVSGLERIFEYNKFRFEKV